MKRRGETTGFDIYFRANLRPHKKAVARKHHAAKARIKKADNSRLFNVPDE